ncbi:MAG TPA: ABC transporter ATP-binding protein [Gemmatimonadaceae bacterium]|nr:ABC transporter ATP-binding protein [Gemmatimonadaceae bacterium]
MTPPPPQLPLIELAALTQGYGGMVVLNGLTATIPRASVGLVGANGAGKSTLMKTLLGILKPTSGVARVLGLSVSEDTIAMRQRVGYMPERGGLPPDQTAADFMIYAAQLAGIPPRAARQRASDVLTLVGLHEERFRHLGDFSTGMLQRALLAQAIVHDPDLVLLDEPLAGLDPEGRDQMLRLIGRLKGFGIHTLVSSHVLSDIESTCDWIVMIEGGQIVQNGTLESLTSGNTVGVEVLDHAEDIATALRQRGATVLRRGHLLEVTMTDSDPYDLINRVLAETGGGTRLLKARVRTLEDAYLAPGHGATGVGGAP